MVASSADNIVIAATKLKDSTIRTTDVWGLFLIYPNLSGLVFNEILNELYYILALEVAINIVILCYYCLDQSTLMLTSNKFILYEQTLLSSVLR